MDKVERKYLEELLYQILKSKEPKKSLLIHKFQNYVWNDEILEVTQEEEDIYITLAHDLNFYEPKEEWRKEDSSYYDEEKLIIEISEALEKLKKLEKE